MVSNVHKHFVKTILDNNCAETGMQHGVEKHAIAGDFFHILVYCLTTNLPLQFFSSSFFIVAKEVVCIGPR